MVMGIQGQHGENLARAQANTDIDYPDEAVLKGAWLRGKPRSARADSMRTSESRMTQLMTVCGHGTRWMPRSLASRVITRQTARKLMRTSKKSRRAIQRHRPWPPGHGLHLAFQLAQAHLGLLECPLGLIPLGFDPCELLAQVRLSSPRCLALPFHWCRLWVDFRKLTHAHALSQAPMATDDGVGGYQVVDRHDQRG